MNVFKKAAPSLIIVTVGILLITAINMSKPIPEVNQDLLAETAKIKVLVQPLKRETVTLSVTSQGTVQPKRNIDLVAQVSGQIINVEAQFENGAFFDQGSLLLEIDPRDYQAAFLNAQSRLAQAKRLLAQEEGSSSQAKKQWRDLGSQEANDLFLRKPQLAEAKSALRFAEADLSIAKLNLERTKIRVPFDGRVQETLVDLGQFVSTGTPLAKVYDISTAEIRLPLSDRQIAILDLPLGITASNNNLPKVVLTATIAGKPYEWPGIISRTEASIDVNSRMYYAIAEVDSPFKVIEDIDGYALAPMIPGLFVSAEISGKNLNEVIVLPRQALVKRQNIYILDEDSSVKTVPVTVLKKHGDMVWVRSDIADNTPIVYEKHALISPGTQVEPEYGSARNSDNATASDPDIASLAAEDTTATDQ